MPIKKLAEYLCEDRNTIKIPLFNEHLQPRFKTELDIDIVRLWEAVEALFGNC